MSELVRCETEGHLAWVTLDRPEVMNALSYDTLLALREVTAGLRADSHVRAVCFTGSGEKAFCAGADLKERVSFTEERTRAFVALIGDTFSDIAALPQPTVAALNGVAFGGGLELALACDMRVAREGVKLGLTETSLAIIPGAGGTQRLPAVVGPARAKELVLAARRIDAQEALRIGLVNAVAPADGLLDVVRELVSAIAACGPLAVRAAKEAIDLASAGGSLSDNLRKERELYLERVLPSQDRLEALAAFRDKRKPEFRGE